ncbi:MAG: class I tRNA ligase family protein [Bdellovibrionota bacterium]
MNSQQRGGPPDIDQLKKDVFRPSRAIITGGMPYANGPIHLGHLAGALIPPDIHARYMRMLIGAEKVLFVCGNDDHGSTSELAALKAGVPVREFIDKIHDEQVQTLSNYTINFDEFSGTSREDCYPIHSELCQDFVRKLHKNGMLEKKTSKQWYDPKLNRFLQDRFVSGKCPNPKCDNEVAYSDQCDKCGATYDPTELINPQSTLSDATPELRDTVHWWLDLWKVSEPLREWIQTKEKTWRSAVYAEVLGTVLPALAFSNTFEEKYKELKATLPKHKSKYAAGKKVQLQFENKKDLNAAKELLDKNAIESSWVDGWAHRSISRDVSWGIPMPVDLDPDMAGKTLYVWPDSLIAPLSFTKLALKKKGVAAEDFDKFWRDPDARIYQFLGQDNIYFYVLMQGAMWIGSQEDISRLPLGGDFQLTDIYASYHLWVSGQKMSKSTGNFHTGDELLNEKGYSADQVRYFLATLSLSDKNSNFDFSTLNERNKFLAGPLNAALEKPIAACHSKFGGKVPEGTLNEKVLLETTKIIQKYLRSMGRADYPVLLGLVENYARNINSLFTQFKPHDDRHPLEERQNALFSSFYILKNIMIMLYPFVPTTMEKLRETLRLPASVFDVNELGTGLPAGHELAEQQSYFPAVAE